MELSEKYIYRVHLAKSFSKAAKALYVSQPSLSAAVAKKEKELGFKVFDRTSKPISLTREGEIYVEMLEEMTQSESDMLHRLSQLNKAQGKAVCVGSGLYTSYYLLPTVCGAFYRRYPEIEVKLDIGNAGAGASLLQKLDNKELDVVFAYDCDQKKYSVYPIYQEQIVIAMHRCFLNEQLAPFAITRSQLLDKTYSPEKEKVDMRAFRDIPFLAFSKNGSAMRYMADILGHYNLSNHSVLNARHGGVHFNMMCAGAGAILTSTSAVQVSGFCSDDIAYFVFQKEISTRKMYAVFRKNEAADENTRRFFEVAKEVCESDKSLSLYYK